MQSEYENNNDQLVNSNQDSLVATVVNENNSNSSMVI